VGSVVGGIDGLGVRFDDGSLVADAGLLLAGTLMDRLGLERLVDEVVRPPEAGRGSGAKALSLVASMLVGGSFIGDAERLRSGSVAAVLPFAPVAPSTLGTWLRSFTFGHVRQLDRAGEGALCRAWSLGAAPGTAEMTVDVDSTICEVFGAAKHGAAYGHTNVWGYHPLVAVRDDTGEVLHVRMRSGGSQRGHVRFVSETLARIKRLAPQAKVTVRADAGFFSYDMIDTILSHDASYSITVGHNVNVKQALAAISEDAWTDIEYGTQQAQIAQCVLTSGHRDNNGPRELRLVVRRSRRTSPQGELWPNWRHHCFITDRHDLDTVAADAYHRAHARIELAIRDLKDNGLAHCPSGRFFANGAWLACAALAHNITRWITRLGHLQHPQRLTVAATTRHRHLTIPGRLVNHSRRHILRLPRNWPWATTFTTALQRLRNLPLLI